MKYEEQKQFFQKCYFYNKLVCNNTNKVSADIKSYLLKIKKQKKGNFLDIGCGDGKYTILAQKLGFKAHGIDYIPKAIKKAKLRAKNLKCTFINNDFFQEKFKIKFNAILDSGFLHHIKKTDWPLYMKKLLKITNRDSHYILSCFSEKDLTHKRTKQHLIHYNHYDYFFSRGDIGKLFSKKFQILKINEENYPSGRSLYNCLMQKY